MVRNLLVKWILSRIMPHKWALIRNLKAMTLVLLNLRERGHFPKEFTN